MSHQTIILVGGPTAAGKSALAMKLARERRGHIVNTDAMQVYEGLPLLTAQPSADDKAAIPHFLYEKIHPSEPYSVGKWVSAAKVIVDDILSKGGLPILVGGTGLYFKAFLEGLSSIPIVPEEVRLRVEELYTTLGEEQFRAKVAVLDPEAAGRIARNDKQRLVRALAVVEHTGQSLSSFQKIKEAGVSEASFRPEIHLVLPDREILYQKCNRRFTTMIENGGIDEVKALLSQNLVPSLPAMKIIGVREIASYLRGDATLAEAVSQAQQMTRNYAKRQMTWFRNQWRHTHMTYAEL